MNLQIRCSSFKQTQTKNVQNKERKTSQYEHQRGAQPTGAYSRAGCRSQVFSKTKGFRKAASPPGRLQRFVSQIVDLRKIGHNIFCNNAHVDP